MEQVLDEHEDLKGAATQLSSVFLAGRKVDTVNSGLEAQGLCTVQVQVSGGRLLILASVDEMLSFFSAAKGSLKASIDMMMKLSAKDLPDAFAMPSLSAVYLRTGDVIYIPCGYVAIEKSIADTSITLRPENSGRDVESQSLHTLTYPHMFVVNVNVLNVVMLLLVFRRVQS